MGVVDTAILGYLTDKLNDFGGAKEAIGGENEARRHAHSASLHRIGEPLLHACHLFGGRGTGLETHHLSAHLPKAHHQSGIRADALS